jgi:plastocyanin
MGGIARFASAARFARATLVARAALVVAVPGAVLLIVGIGAAQAATKAVSIAGFAFSPSSITINVGDSVTWTNNDGTTHTVTADAGAFDSGDVGSSATYSHKFTTAGSFAYHCTIHSFMTGTVTVKSATPSPSPSPKPSVKPSTNPSPKPSIMPPPTIPPTVPPSPRVTPVPTAHTTPVPTSHPSAGATPAATSTTSGATTPAATFASSSEPGASEAGASDPGATISSSTQASPAPASISGGRPLASTPGEQPTGTAGDATPWLAFLALAIAAAGVVGFALMRRRGAA